MTEPWKAGDGTETEAVVLLPNGTEVKVKDSAPFAETIRKIAREHGLSKFNVKIDGSQIDASAAPNDFKDVDEVELVKYDEGA